MSGEVKTVIGIVAALAAQAFCPASVGAVSPDAPVPSLPVSHAFTNHAGKVVSGAFGGVTNGTVTVAGRTYPLSIFPETERLRMKKLAGLDVRTAKAKRLDRAREMKLARIRVREEEGEIDRATADDLRREATSAVPSPAPHP